MAGVERILEGHRVTEIDLSGDIEGQAASLVLTRIADRIFRGTTEDTGALNVAALWERRACKRFCKEDLEDSVTIRAKIDLSRLKNTLPQIKEQFKKDLPRPLASAIRKDILRGISPVKGKRFARYSRSYSEAKSSEFALNWKAPQEFKGH